MPRQRGRPGLGLLLLANQIYNAGGLNAIPPVTLLTLIGQVLLFLGFINPPWHRYDVCISAEAILKFKDYKRIILSAIEHVDDIHLYHNMASFIFKGRTLERRYGSMKFMILLLVFTVATSIAYVGLMWGATEFFEDSSYMSQCAIGFSGVLFALKVLTTHYGGASHSKVFGIPVPSKYVVWAELVVIHILVPRASFVGHLAGILVGLAYIWGPLRQMVEFIHQTISGAGYPYRTRSYAPSYTYTRATTGPAREYDADTRPQYTPVPDVDELRRQRLQRYYHM